MKKTYSKKLADIIKSYCDSVNLTYEFDEELGEIEFSTELNSKIEEMYCRIIISEDYYCVIGHFDLHISDETIDNIMEYLHKINYYSYFSTFVIDLNKKEIYSQCYTNCIGVIPTQEIIKESILSAKELVERYGDILVDISEGREPSKEVFEKLIEEELEKEY